MNKREFLEGRIVVYNADCLDVMKEIEDKKFSLILSDGPYFKICGNFDWAFKTMREWIDWHCILRDEWERVLADNGSLLIFGDDKNIAYLQVEFDKKFNLLNSLVYRKINALTMKGLHEYNSFAPITERILFYDKGENKTGLEMVKKIMPNPFASYLREEFSKAKVSNNEIAKLFPSVTGGITGCVSNWLNGSNIITKEQYLRIRIYLDNKYLRKEYEDLRKEYEDLRRPFNTHHGLSDVIDAKLKSGFHPTIKDQAVIEKLIDTTTKQNDLVFSPFLGSGTDALACIRTNRRLIGCELDPIYFEKMCERIETELKQLTLF